MSHIERLLREIDASLDEKKYNIYNLVEMDLTKRTG